MKLPRPDRRALKEKGTLFTAGVRRLKHDL